MRLTTPPLTIDEEEPFKGDALDRKPFGEALLNLTTRTEEELVICLDAPWGEGKTTFVKMWQTLLAQNEISSIYFDAFSNDYIDDAFVAIVSAITDFLEKQKQDSKTKKTLKDFKKKASQLGVQLLSWAIKLGVKAGTLGVVQRTDVEELMSIKDDIATGTSEVISRFIEDRITAHSQEIENVVSFRDTLSRLAASVGGSSGRPLIIIIDELDRCKPTYAIEVMEKIKHLFSVQNVVFILVMHREQLEESIKWVYGQNIDATSYLQKFINVNCSLPKRTESRSSGDYYQYCRRLYDLHELQTWGDDSNLLSDVSALARHFNLSLRQLEKCFTHLSIFYASVSVSTWRLTSLIAFLSVVKAIKPKLYNELQNGRMSYGNLAEHTGLGQLRSEDETNDPLNHVVLALKFCLYTDEEYNLSKVNEFKDMTQSLFRYNIKRGAIIPFYCRFFDIIELK